MGFFNDLSKKTSEATLKIAQETKLKLKINENKGKIKEIYGEIGKQVYENHVKEIQNNDELLKEKCNQIDSLSSEIEKARIEILTLNHKKMCKKCFAEIEDNATFCSKCGEKQTEEAATLEKAEEKLEQTEVQPNNEEKKEEVKKELQEKNAQQ